MGVRRETKGKDGSGKGKASQAAVPDQDQRRPLPSASRGLPQEGLNGSWGDVGKVLCSTRNTTSAWSAPASPGHHPTPLAAPSYYSFHTRTPKKIEADFWETALEMSKWRDTCGPTAEAAPVPIRAGPCPDQHPMFSPVGSPWWGCTAAQGGRNTSRVSPVSPVPCGGTRLPAHGWAGGDARLHLSAASHHPPAAGSWDAPRDLLRLGGVGAFWTAAARRNPPGKPQTGLCLSQLSAAKNMSCCFGASGREAEPHTQPFLGPDGPPNTPKPITELRTWCHQTEAVSLWLFLRREGLFGHLCPGLGCKAIGCKTLRCRGRTLTTGSVCGCWGPRRVLSLALAPSEGDARTPSPTLGFLLWGTQPARGTGVQS